MKARIRMEDAREPSGLLAVPGEVWDNLRAHAIYRFLYDRLWHEADPDFMLVDETHGKIRALSGKLENYFSASGGTIDDPLNILRKWRIVEKETADGRMTGWWIFRFADNAPETNESPLALWNLRARNSKNVLPVAEVPPPVGKKRRMVSPAAWDGSRGARALAAYHFLARSFMNHDAGFEMIDEDNGRVHAPYAKIENALATNPGGVDRAIKSLQARGILEREEREKGERVSFIFHFSSDVPAIPKGETIESLWHSRDGMKGRGFYPSPALITEPGKRGPTMPAVQSSAASGSIEEQLRKIHELEKQAEELRTEVGKNAHALVTDLSRDAVAVYRKARKLDSLMRTVMEADDIITVNRIIVGLQEDDHEEVYAPVIPVQAETHEHASDTDADTDDADAFLDNFKEGRAKKGGV